MRLYITRHGETIWNTEGRSQGTLNSDLTDMGKLQARKLKDRLEPVQFEKIYVSPLGRTRQTAAILLEDRSVEVEYLEELMEMNMGKWQGLVKEDIQALYAEERYLFGNEPEQYKSVEGEDFYELKARVEKALGIIQAKEHTGNVLVVTHGITKKMMVTVMEEKTVKEVWNTPWMKPTALTIAEYDGNHYNIKVCGDISHYE